MLVDAVWENELNGRSLSAREFPRGPYEIYLGHLGFRPFSAALLQLLLLLYQTQYPSLQNTKSNVVQTTAIRALGSPIPPPATARLLAPAARLLASVRPSALIPPVRVQRLGPPSPPRVRPTRLITSTRRIRRRSRQRRTRASSGGRRANDAVHRRDQPRHLGRGARAAPERESPWLPYARPNLQELIMTFLLAMDVAGAAGVWTTPEPQKGQRSDGQAATVWICRVRPCPSSLPPLSRVKLMCRSLVRLCYRLKV